MRSNPPALPAGRSEIASALINAPRNDSVRNVIIGTLQLEIHFFKPQSLKEKRVLLKSLLSRLRQRFNVSISEIDGMDLWQASTLAIAAIGGEQRHVNQLLDHVTDFVRGERELEISRQHMEFF